MSLRIVPTVPTAVPDLAYSTAWPVVVEAYLSAAYCRHRTECIGALGVPTLIDLTGADPAHCRRTVIATALEPASQAQAFAALRSLMIGRQVHG